MKSLEGEKVGPYKGLDDRPAYIFGARIDASNEGLGSEQVDIQVLLDYASLHFLGLLWVVLMKRIAIEQERHT